MYFSSYNIIKLLLTFTKLSTSTPKFFSPNQQLTSKIPSHPSEINKNKPPEQKNIRTQGKNAPKISSANKIVVKLIKDQSFNL